MSEVPPWFFRQAGVIPVRARGDDMEVALITSSGGKRWVIPKGVIDPGESARETAARETLEEAGVSGRLSPEPIGRYSYRKWGGTCEVDVFLLLVDDELATWMESGIRERRWLSPEAAARLVREPALKQLIAETRLDSV
ncbi:MAG: NUDIX hydrolase [Phycisphaerales bacterium]|nr:NUDIX hydrolase [Phycisphaerae bacterium]NNF41845.1 NUDIX hydrolase [Phycisphaerales bacterium]NNM24592.1 NUDIX hydrolase [Phycisphaerales bacterium]